MKYMSYLLSSSFENCLECGQYVRLQASSSASALCIEYYIKDKKTLNLKICDCEKGIVLEEYEINSGHIVFLKNMQTGSYEVKLTCDEGNVLYNAKLITQDLQIA
ncbi:MAG: hypothetical protein RL131_10 [Bacteroidota bacterium]